MSDVPPKTLTIAVVMTGGEGFGVRTFLLNQFRHAEASGLQYHYLSLQPGAMCRELQSLGADVSVVGGGVPVGYPRSALLLPLFWMGWLGTLREAHRGLFRALQALRPDVIYTQQIYTSFLCGLIARRLGLPIVGQLHGLLSRQRLLGLQRILCSVILSRMLDAIVAISQAHLNAWWGPARRKARVIYNAIEVDAIRACVAGVEKIPGRLVIVGRLQALKKQELLIRAVRVLADEGIACTLDVVGGPTDDANPHYRRLVELVRTLGLEDRVVFRGQLAPPYSCVAAAEVCVNCSTVESFGLVVAEAMACGTPVVVSNSGAPAELVEDGRTGVIFVADEVTSLASALRRLLGDSAERARLASAALSAAQRRFSPAVHMQTLRRLFDEVVKVRPASGSR